MISDRGGYWYIATPYSKFAGGLDEAYRQANEAAAKICQKYGVRVFCPIGHSHSLCECYGTDGGLPEARSAEFWEWFDKPFLDKCDGVAVVMMDGWGDSVGVLHEINTAEDAGKPVVFLRYPSMEIADGGW